jgi:hypothetical protein
VVRGCLITHRETAAHKAGLTGGDQAQVRGAKDRQVDGAGGADKAMVACGCELPRKVNVPAVGLYVKGAAHIIQDDTSCNAADQKGALHAAAFGGASLIHKLNLALAIAEL